MSPAAKSVYFFGFYLYLIGLTLMIVPNFFLTTIQLPETNEVWIRIVGVLVFCIGFYYHRIGAGNITEVIKMTITARLFVCLVFTVFVAAKIGPVILLFFGAVDLLGALWTWLALKRSN